MTLSLKIIGLICLMFILSICVFAQETQSSSTKTFSVCRFEILTQATFRIGFRYILDVDTNGQVSKVTELANIQREKKFKAVRDELLVECMKKWRLAPAGKYFVSFNGGTTSIGTSGKEPRDFMMIIDPNKQSLIVELPLFYVNRDKKADEIKEKQ